MIVHLDDQWREKLPGLRLWVWQADVTNSSFNKGLWQAIDARVKQMQQQWAVADIARQPAIQATRKAYKTIGQDPARYRPSAEALYRRIVKGKALYQINTLVDCINYLSLSSGFSIGGYDSQAIHGNVTFGVGEKDEPYQAIGKGVYNIEKLPVLRDARGAFGSPTSDSQRTAIGVGTRQLLMVVFDFGASDYLPAFQQEAQRVFNEYAQAKPLMNEMIV